MILIKTIKKKLKLHFLIKIIPGYFFFSFFKIEMN